jgi:hypothetical protein
MDKVQTPPSGSKHDFFSMSPYWWPDTTKPNGLPYIRRDGERNPECDIISDPSQISEIIHAVETLTVAYYITSKTVYAVKAQELLNRWFIDEKTKMNPNMNHAQYIPGRNTGRGSGIIETHEIYKILDAIVLLRTSKYWSQLQDGAMNKWFEDYYQWLTTHEYGIEQSNQRNNYGTWYDMQVSALALFLGKEIIAKKILEEVKKKRIDVQIAQDGKQPLELGRTNSWEYSNFNLMALMHLALLGDHVGVNLWRYESPNGGSILKALKFLLPIAKDPLEWKYTQIEKMRNDNIFILLHIAKQKYIKEKDSEWILFKSTYHYSVRFIDSLI